MAMGVFMALVAMARYRIVLQRLELGEFQPARTIIVFLGSLTALLGVILIAYLLLTARTL